MRQETDKWLQEKIDADLTAMTEEREKLLMESEAFQGIDMPMERLEEIHRRVDENRTAHKRLRFRAYFAVAAALALCVGVGIASSGNKMYVPEIFRWDQSTKVNNSDAAKSQYNEEEVCKEIEEKLGALPVRFSYRPEGMNLAEYWLKEYEKETLLIYEAKETTLHIYINKKNKDSAVGNRTDGEKLDTLTLVSCGLDVPVYKYKDSNGQAYFETSFEYLNTYYLITGKMGQEEFEKILENIWIKNA